MSDNITRIYLEYKDYESKFDYEVKYKLLKKTIKPYKLKRTFYEALTLSVRNTCIRFIPFKNLRHKLKKKYHV